MDNTNKFFYLSTKSLEAIEEKLLQLATNITPQVAYARVGVSSFGRCGDGSCSMSCSGGCGASCAAWD